MKIDQKDFLKKYGIDHTFFSLGIKWEDLEEIAEDYLKKKDEIFKEIAVKYVEEINSFDHVHSVRFRLKDVEHLLEKVIRKAIEYQDTDTVYNKDTYLTEITDIIGIRALYVFKSDFLPLHNKITSMYKKSFCEKAQVKLREGDDKKIYSGLKNVEFQTGADYRSIHYTLRHNYDKDLTVPIEIQTRSIFEEGWSEINHKLLYKKSATTDTVLLKQASSVLSSLAGDCDTLAQLMKQIAEHNDDTDILKATEVSSGSELLDEMLRFNGNN